MRVKTVLLFIATALIFACAVFLNIPRETPEVYLDIRMVNDIVKTLSADWDNVQAGGIALPFQHETDYAVIDNSGRLIAATRDGLSGHINDAIGSRDTIVDITSDGYVIGKVIFHNDTARIFQQNRARFIFASTVMFLSLMIMLAGYNLYLNRTLLRPFGKMQSFARQIAAGNLDVPLEMDRNNLFGAFTESFDLMREELRSARENERKADRSKKELVASLSHDIKTPVASIKASTELMLFMMDNEEYREQLEGINAKAEQINTLITDMFHSTLEELQALSVTSTEVQSAAVQNLIRYADYEKRVKPFKLPDCLVSADLTRLQQVFDNIIGNSYKYAGTDIEVGAFFDGRHLIIDIIDFGKGVADEELPLVFNKFFRGKEAGAKSGYGLGLYISKYIMEEMSGGISCASRTDGFSVRLALLLAG